MERTERSDARKWFNAHGGKVIYATLLGMVAYVMYREHKSPPLNSSRVKIVPPTPSKIDFTPPKIEMPKMVQVAHPPIPVRKPPMLDFGPPEIPLEPGEIFPAALAKGCSPDPRTFLDGLEKDLVAKRLVNKLYLLETPEGSVRIRVIVRYEGRMQLGFLNNPAGVAVFHDGPYSPVRDAFVQALDLLASDHGLQVRAKISAGVPGGCQMIDDLAKF